MKDRQVEPSGVQPRIPVISPLLHCVSMTALVYLRSSFGFVYLRPKSVFFAFSWAFALFTVYAWNEPEVWQQYRAGCFFGIVAIALYYSHLLIAFVRELYHRGEHDHYSGKSHPIQFMRWTGRVPNPHFEMNVHLWAEPLAILVAALILRFVLGERHLSTWLAFAALCLWFKEAFNYWHHLRQKKRQGDIFDDAGDTVEPPSANPIQQEPPKASRKARVKRQRSADQDLDHERRFAELLRLLPPYTLAAAEHYRALIKAEHPDANDGTPESTTKSGELNEAIEFFRERLRE
jgi:hypothetical protein